MKRKISPQMSEQGLKIQDMYTRIYTSERCRILEDPPMVSPPLLRLEGTNIRRQTNIMRQVFPAKHIQNLKNLPTLAFYNLFIKDPIKVQLSLYILFI